MKKKILALGLSCVMMLSCTTMVFADTSISQLSESGNNNAHIGYSEGSGCSGESWSVSTFTGNSTTGTSHSTSSSISVSESISTSSIESLGKNISINEQGVVTYSFKASNNNKEDIGYFKFNTSVKNNILSGEAGFVQKSATKTTQVRKISFIYNNKLYTAKTDNKLNFTVNIPNLKKGKKIIINMAGSDYSYSCCVVLGKSDVVEVGSVETIYGKNCFVGKSKNNKNTYTETVYVSSFAGKKTINGTCSTNGNTVYVIKGNQLYKTTVKNNKFSVKTKTANKKNEKINVIVLNNKNLICSSVLAKVNTITLDTPTISKYKKNTKVVSGKALAKSTVYIKYNGKEYKTNANSKGVYSVKTAKLVKNKKVSVYIADKYGNKSKTKTVTIK